MQKELILFNNKRLKRLISIMTEVFSMDMFLSELNCTLFVLLRFKTIFTRLL